MIGAVKSYFSRRVVGAENSVGEVASLQLGRGRAKVRPRSAQAEYTLNRGQEFIERAYTAHANSLDIHSAFSDLSRLSIGET